MKKLLALNLALTCFATTLVPMTAMAAGETASIGTLSGETPAYGETLTVSVTGASQQYAVDKWIIGDTEVESDGSDTYIVTEADAGKSISAVVAFEDESTITTDAVAIPKRLYYDNVPMFTYVSDIASDPAAASKFTYEGQSFTLADTFNNEKSKYFIIANETYGVRLRDKNKLDENSIINTWLNGDFLSYGNENGVKPLSSVIQKHIDFDHYWATEGSSGDFQFDPYAYKAGVSVLSASELKMYGAKAGYDMQCIYMLRSVLNGNSVHYLVVPAKGAEETYDTTVRLSNWDAPSSCNIRPVFYLDGGFFKEAAIDLSTAGDEVKEAVKAVGWDALKKIYSTQDLIAYLGMEAGDDVMDIRDMKINTVSGEELKYGETVKASFNYADTTPLASYTINWKTVGSDEILGTGDEYVITEADTAKTLYYTMIATDTNGKTVSMDSESYAVPERLVKSRIVYTDPQLWSCNKDSNPDYTFTYGGKKYVLADVLNNEASKYFIISDELYGTRTRDKLKLDESSALQSWLNGDFVNYGNNNGAITPFPKTLTKHIDFNHLWKTEGNDNNFDNYSFKAGVTVPSWNELKIYTDKAGFNLGSTYMLRTTLNGNSSNYLVLDAGGSTDTMGKIGWWSVPSAINIRPVFYLDGGFFADAAIDLATAGSAVINEIKKVDEKTLLSIYSMQDMVKYLGYTAPENYIYINNLAIGARSGADTAAYGDTLEVSFEYGKDNTAPLADWTADWKADGVKVGEGKSYIVTEADAGKTITADVIFTTTDGKTDRHTANALAIPTILIQNSIVAGSEFGSIKNTADADKFTVGGKEFSLIRQYDNDKSTFFVAAEEVYGLVENRSNKFDPNNDLSMQYWLSNSFAKGDVESGDTLPDDITNYIDFDHIWLTEGAPSATNPIEAPYTFKAGVTVPSISEIKRNDNMGYAVNDSSTYFVRTPADYSENGKTFSFVSGTDKEWGGVLFNHWDLPSTAGVRPVFYLSGDFFKNVKMDIENIGDNVFEMMKNTYSLDELAHLYTADEIALLEEGGFKWNLKTNVSFKNYDESADVTELAGATSLKAIITVENNTGAAVNTKAYIALYDGFDRLAGIDIADISVGNGSSATVKPGFETLSGVDAGYKVKVMIFGDDMTPLLKSAKTLGTTGGTAATKAALSSAAVGNNFFAASQL